MVSYPQKVDALTRILEVENFEGMIVFVRTKNETETLAEKLRARGFSATAINGDIVQAQRERTIGELRDGKLDILVATDVAARGLDVDRISHVVNYDIPTDPESYVHRIGRTGRAGRSGDAISFVTPRERYLLRSIEKTTRQPLTQMQLPTVEDVNVTRLARFDDAITRGAVVDRAGLVLPRRGVPLRPRARRARASTSPPRWPSYSRATLPCCSSPSRSVRAPRERPERPDAATIAATARQARAPRRPDDAPMATYRIAVGKRHKVEPRQIVGALANEGGLTAATSGTSRSAPTSPSSSCPPNCRRAPRRGWPAPASPASSSSCASTTARPASRRKPRHKNG